MYYVLVAKCVATYSFGLSENIKPIDSVTLYNYFYIPCV